MKGCRLGVKCYVLAAALLVFPDAMRAQVFGSITGVVLDSTGAGIPAATVTITNQETGVVNTRQTQHTGVYLARQLQSGTYTLTAEAPGFKKMVVAGLRVDVGTTLTQDMVLEIGQLTETVEVTARNVQLQTTSGEVGANVTLEQVQEMPLNSRNVFALMNLVPGVIMKVGVDNPGNPYGAITVAGGRNLQTLPLLDGMLNSPGPIGNQAFNMAPPVEAMQEFKVHVNNLSAEHGRTVGGVVSAVTRSGTNAFHGMFYEYLRNDAFDAKGWGNDSKPPLRRNTFGANIGGPIIRNRTFFFYNYDGMRNKQSATLTRNVGLPEWRTGDFSTATRQVGNSAQMVVIYDPQTGSGTLAAPRDTQPFPGNRIPLDRLDPVAVNALKYLPDPNRAPDNPFNQTGNWQLNSKPSLRRDYHIMRIDHELASATKIFGRYIVTVPDRTFEEYLPGWGVMGGTGGGPERRSQNLALNATHLFTPTFFLNLNGGMHRFRNRWYSGGCCAEGRGAEFGMQGLPADGSFATPFFNLGGGPAPVSNLGGHVHRALAYNVIDIVANFTKVHGNHTFLFGAQHTSSSADISIRLWDAGRWTFDGRYTRGTNAAGGAIANTGLPLADFLLGHASAIDGAVEPLTTRRLLYYASYFQDDWRVTRRLTLNLGLRWETETPDYETSGKRSNFNPFLPNPLAGTGDIPAGAMGQFEFQGRDGRGKYLSPWRKKNLGPRFGFAYHIGGRSDLVIRGGYGIFFGDLNPGGGVEWGRYGFSPTIAFAHPIPFRLQDGFPPGAWDPPAESELTPGFGSRGTKYPLAGIEFTHPYQKMPYTQNLNLGIQRQWRDMVIEVAYLGNLARRIDGGNQNLNLIPVDLLSRTEIPERLRRPFTAYASDQAMIRIWQESSAISNYHALTARMERRFSHGLAWTVAYTLSNWIDDTSGGGVGNENPGRQDLRIRDRSLSASHTPQRLVFSPIFELPFGRSKAFLNRGGILNALAGGWQISTMGTLQSGYPMSVTVLNGGRDIRGDGAAQALLWPHLVGEAKLPNQGEPAVGVRGIQWLNSNAFAIPERFTLGNLGRTVPGVLSPGTVNFDAMLAKSFSISERIRAQFRWEAFNTLNTPNWGVPAKVVGAGNFGVITSAGGRRIMQFGLRLTY